MTKLSSYAIILTIILACAASAVAQSGPARGPDPGVQRDPLLEADSKHNLEVARMYYRLRKAYQAALSRCEEIYAANPEFSRIDEVLYYAGMSSLRLSEGKGKQKPKDTPGKLREDARKYLSELVKNHPESEFRKGAEQELAALGGPLPKQQP